MENVTLAALAVYAAQAYVPVNKEGYTALRATLSAAELATAYLNPKWFVGRAANFEEANLGFLTKKTIESLPRVCPNAAFSLGGLYLDTDKPYRGSGHSRKDEVLKKEVELLLPPWFTYEAWTKLYGVAQRVFNDHESPIHRASRARCAHYQGYSKCGIGGFHRYLAIWLISNNEVDDLLGGSPEYALRDAFFHSIEAVDILLSGYWQEESDPVNIEAVLLEVETAKPDFETYNRDQALNVGKPFDSQTGKIAGLKSAELMPYIRAKRMGKPSGTTATWAEYMEWVSPGWSTKWSGLLNARVSAIFI